MTIIARTTRPPPSAFVSRRYTEAVRIARKLGDAYGLCVLCMGASHSIAAIRKGSDTDGNLTRVLAPDSSGGRVPEDSTTQHYI